MTLEIHYEKRRFFHKVFDNNQMKFGKIKKAKIKKKNIFDSPLILNQTFSQTEFVIGKSGFVHIMHFQLTKCLIFVKFKSLKILAIKQWFPFNFAKILQGHHFLVRGAGEARLQKTSNFYQIFLCNFSFFFQKIVLLSLQLFSCACY